MRIDPSVILVVIVYLLVFGFACYMAIRVESTRIERKHRHEAFWHYAR